MKISNETKVGILATVAIVLLFIGYSFLKGNDVFSSDNTFYTTYTAVDGLTPSKPVLVNGYQIGRVSKMILQADGKIKTEFKIHSHYDIPKNTVARISSTDLLGSKAIVFEMGNSKELAKDGDFLTSGVQPNIMDKVEPIQKRIETITIKLDSTLSVVNTVLDKQFQDDFKRSIHSISTSLKNVEGITKDVEGLVGDEKGRLNRIMANLESITSNFSQNGEKINAIMSNLNNITDKAARLDFEHTMNKVNAAVNDFQEITGKINSGKGSIGLLLNDEALYNNLNNASKEMDNLMKDVKEKPGKYIKLSIFGKKGEK
ncbi:MlaD family protein [Sphingobacterium siyangense]|uniref:MlaD family protein n=1 Tax=Sphingobacterium siyangense TaxID=459529 RepID=UPI000F9A1D21|nr:MULTISPECIES: MlaD family protein [Sphingobacterium]QQT31665.1 MCE family protein [Sphingobacterium multivorum]